MQWDGIAAKLYFALGVVALLAIPVGLAWAGLWLVGLLFALPMVAWLVSRLLVQQGGDALGWISSLPLRKWQGSYYAFNDVNEHEAIRFLQWMRCEVVKPWERKRERA